MFLGSSSRRATIKFDWITLLLTVLLIATLLAFFTGVFPYPVGWIVLSALLLFRLTANSGGQ
jgi:dihydroxy-acid dehydratase